MHERRSHSFGEHRRRSGLALSAAVRLLRLSALLAKLAVPVAPWIFERDSRCVPGRGR